jgi:hypothetical protein
MAAEGVCSGARGKLLHEASMAASCLQATERASRTDEVVRRLTVPHRPLALSDGEGLPLLGPAGDRFGAKPAHSLDRVGCSFCHWTWASEHLWNAPATVRKSRRFRSRRCRSAAKRTRERGDPAYCPPAPLKMRGK